MSEAYERPEARTSTIKERSIPVANAQANKFRDWPGEVVLGSPECDDMVISTFYEMIYMIHLNSLKWPCGRRGGKEKFMGYGEASIKHANISIETHR